MMTFHHTKFWMTAFLGLLLASGTSFAQVTETEEETEIDAKKMMTEALSDLQMGDAEEATKSLEKVIEADKTNYQAMLMASQAYMQWGVEMAQDDRKAANVPLRRGAELMRVIQTEKEHLSDIEKQVLATAVYNEACCAAVDGEADKAIKLLEESIQLGFRELDTLKHDSDFESIKNDDRFKTIVDKLEEQEDENNEEDQDV